ncbi:microtubule-binding protein BIM1 NDAI_0E03590 [Naumovozyma dairenensis CBS 421]|uniref:Calponin-homology (CH) domain-containing protein n=1 Tax=Naumovozyma dairenensis (strain ATCC 10597 / BCRC 20456 / CBS 421 / NBRC 0211 / NRRL Y-12639) TaxID=1071378 RepID=G0WBQ6_NAUDC|nr:hypothetical protein NDAI_0E03590 [Naumovozyma dairenensis CBS 421]CCD25176.1 hypothetical protein NDAI_0E03590 [Naumovozyma dairenensis CBS 421]
MNNIGESRSELLNWLNNILKLNYKKIEECGTGAAYCQIMDSIYNDVPMHRVKFNATAEYDYQINYKILQSCFSRHRIEKTIYVEKLMKCRFQDNLEFLQWSKKFWQQNKDSTEYDPNSRRKYRPNPSAGNSNGPTSNITKRKTSGFGLNNNSSTSLHGGPIVASRSASLGMNRRVSNEQLIVLQTELSQAQGSVQKLKKEIDTYKETVTILERERSFYFGKLRDIEVLVQSTQDLIKEGVYKTETSDLDKFLSKVQQILYATEEGFEVVDEDEKGIAAEEQHNSGQSENDIVNGSNERVEVSNTNLIIDEETF